jgi:hypothetical protein
MGQRILREVEFYVDAAGRSDVRDALDRISERDRRAFKVVQNRLRMLTEVDLRQALATPLLKQPTATIYVLRAQSGPVSYRLPFFESPCHAGRLVVVTHGEHRSVLRGDRYKTMIEAAERRRQDWIRRNC